MVITQDVEIVESSMRTMSGMRVPFLGCCKVHTATIGCPSKQFANIPEYVTEYVREYVTGGD